MNSLDFPLRESLMFNSPLRELKVFLFSWETFPKLVYSMYLVSYRLPNWEMLLSGRLYRTCSRRGWWWYTSEFSSINEIIKIIKQSLEYGRHSWNLRNVSLVHPCSWSGTKHILSRKWSYAITFLPSTCSVSSSLISCPFFWESRHTIKHYA